MWVACGLLGWRVERSGLSRGVRRRFGLPVSLNESAIDPYLAHGRGHRFAERCSGNYQGGRRALFRAYCFEILRGGLFDRVLAGQGVSQTHSRGGCCLRGFRPDLRRGVSQARLRCGVARSYPGGGAKLSNRVLEPAQLPKRLAQAPVRLGEIGPEPDSFGECSDRRIQIRKVQISDAEVHLRLGRSWFGPPGSAIFFEGGLERVEVFPRGRTVAIRLGIQQIRIAIFHGCFINSPFPRERDPQIQMRRRKVGLDADRLLVDANGFVGVFLGCLNDPEFEAR